MKLHHLEVAKIMHKFFQKQNAFKFFYNFVELNNVHNYNTRQKIYSAYSWHARLINSVKCIAL